MPRNITVTFKDGSTHVYENAPDEIKPDEVFARAAKDFPDAGGVTALDGGREEGSLGEDAPAAEATVTDEAPNRFIDESEPGAFEALQRGATSGISRGFDDEITSAISAGLIAPFSDQNYNDLYQDIVTADRLRKQKVFDEHPVLWGSGFLPSALVGAGKIPMAQTGFGRLAQALGIGAAEGGVSGAGNADEGDILSSAGWGAALGGPFGVAGAVLGPLVGGLVRRAADRVGPRGPGTEASGLNALDRIAPQDPDAMRAAAERFQRAGTPFRIIDVADESGRGVVRTAAGKITPAREEAARQADQVYAGAQDRVVEQARRNITDNPQTARQLEREITGDPALGVEGTRNTAMAAAIEPERAASVPLNDEVKAIFSTREGQAALRGAEGLMTDPADRKIVQQVRAAAAKAAKGPTDPEDAFRAEVKGWDDLPEPVKAAYRAQRPDLAGVADPYAGIELTVDMADKIARAMKGRAANTPGLERVATQFGNAIRNAARDANETYAQAIDDYAAASRVADAASGGGQFEGTDFLKSPADDFSARVRSAAANAPEDIPLSEAEAIRLRARDEVVDRATQGSGAQAGSVARQLAQGGGDTGAGQRARNEALLGPEGARALEEGMQAEVDRVVNTRFIDPRAGSKTAGQLSDTEVVDGFLEHMGNVATAGKWGVAREALRWLRRGGIRNVDAERLTRDAISEDPRRVMAAIDYLEQRGMQRQNAERMIGRIGSILGGRTAGGAQGEAPSKPPSSVRDLYSKGQ